MSGYERDEREGEVQRICAITLIGQHQINSSWFCVIQYVDVHGVTQMTSIPRKDCHNASGLRGHLLDRGARLPDDLEPLRKIVREILLGDLPVVQPAAVSGWHWPAYRFGDQFIGTPDQQYVVISSEKSRYPLELAAGGSARSWSDEFAKLPTYSYPITLAVCVAFASVMAGPLGIEPRMIHLFGTSSGGKTLALISARGVFGNPSRDRILTWNTTATGFEELAAQIRDHLFVIDEATFKTGGIADENLLKVIHYSFSSGQQKQRSQSYGQPQVFTGAGSSKLGLSTGELSFAEVAKRAGSKRFGGAVLRAVDVPADLEYGLGVFRTLPSNLQGRTDGARLYAQRLEAAAVHNYGWVGKCFIEHLVASHTWKADARRRMVDFQKELKVGSDGYSIRFADVFVLAYAAGRAVIDADLVDWSINDLARAIAQMYRAARKYAASPLETCENVIKNLRRELEHNAVDLDRRMHIDDLAFRRANAFFRVDSNLGPIYLVKPEYIQKLCGIDISSRDVATALQKLGMLIPENPAIPTRQFMTGANRPRKRYYCIRESFIHRQPTLAITATGSKNRPR